MYMAKVEHMFIKIYARLKQARRWEAFLKQLKRRVDEDDHFSILIDRLDDLLLKFKIKLSRAQKHVMLRTIPAASVGGQRRDLINIRLLYKVE
jgi:hypothetical protein